MSVRALTSTSSICEVKARYQQISNDISKVFDSWISPFFVQKLWQENYFFAVLARSALRRQRVQSDLLDGTAFQASTLVACTEGPLHKEIYTYFALCFYLLGKLTQPRLVHVCTPPFSDRRPPTTPTAVVTLVQLVINKNFTKQKYVTWRKCTVPATLHPLPLPFYATVIADVIAVSYTHAEAYALLCFHYNKMSFGR